MLQYLARMEQGQKFKVLFSSLGTSAKEVEKLLHVTPRTIHNWIGGSVHPPYMNVRSLRLHLRYELCPTKLAKVDLLPPASR